MPVSSAFRVAKGGFTTLAGEIDHQARAAAARLRREFNALTTDVEGKVDKSLLDDKGDIAIGGAVSVGTLAVGADGTIPVADSAAAAGVAYKGGAVELDHQEGDGTSTVLIFSSIPDDYQHLVLEGTVDHGNESAGDAHRLLGFQLNNDGGANYDRFISFRDDDDGAAIQAPHTNSGGASGGIGYVGSIASPITIWIPNYSAAGSIAKSVLSKGSSYTSPTVGSGAWRLFDSTSRWINTAVINRVDLQIIAAAGDEFSISTKLTLYGLSR